MGAHEGRELGKVGEANAFQALGKNKEALVGHLDDFVDDGKGSDGIEIGGLRRIDAGLALRYDDDGFVVAERIDQLDRTFTADRQGKHGVRKQDGIADRENGEGATAHLVRNRIADFAHDFLLSHFHSTFG